MTDEFAPARLVEYTTTKPGPRFGLLMAQFPLEKEFEERKLRVSGHTWGAVVRLLLEMLAPELADRVSYDCEGDMFVARAMERDALARVAGFIQMVMEEPVLLDAVIQRAGGRIAD